MCMCVRMYVYVCAWVCEGEVEEEKRNGKRKCMR